MFENRYGVERTSSVAKNSPVVYATAMGFRTTTIALRRDRRAPDAGAVTQVERKTTSWLQSRRGLFVVNLYRRLPWGRRSRQTSFVICSAYWRMEPQENIHTIPLPLAVINTWFWSQCCQVGPVVYLVSGVPMEGIKWTLTIAASLWRLRINESNDAFLNQSRGKAPEISKACHALSSSAAPVDRLPRRPW